MELRLDCIFSIETLLLSKYNRFSLLDRMLIVFYVSFLLKLEGFHQYLIPLSSLLSHSCIFCYLPCIVVEFLAIHHAVKFIYFLHVVSYMSFFFPGNYRVGNKIWNPSYKGNYSCTMHLPLSS